MPKRTYPIRSTHTEDLISSLVEEYGYPDYLQELVLYLTADRRIKISLTRERFSISWRPANEDPDQFHHRRRGFRIGRSDLKEKLIFLAEMHGSQADISISLVYRFTVADQTAIEVRPNSLIGPIATTRISETLAKSGEGEEIHLALRDKLDPFVHRSTEEFIGRVDRIDGEPTEFIHFGIGKEPILNTKILNFCRQNGIVNPFKREITYRSMLSSRNNDYSGMERLFRQFTGTELLSLKSTISWPRGFEGRASVIVPCFNTNDTLRPLLLSIACQSIPEDHLKNLEVVLVDDASSEPVASAVNVDDYPFELRIIRSHSNVGVARARLLGTDFSNGDILVFLDSDLILSRHYLADHILRNHVLRDAVFVSFKENIPRTDPRCSDEVILRGISRPEQSQDLRISKTVKPSAIGSYKVAERVTVNILEETNYFKDFHGSRIFGIYDLSCMVTGHNFSTRRSVVERTKPFSPIFKGWGMEDVYFGLRVIADGNFIVPVLSSGVLHQDHPPRSGSEEDKEREYRKNVELIDSVLDSLVQ